MIPPATISLAFDPLVHIGDVDVRIQTLVLAAIILEALVLAVRVARVTPVAGPYVPAPTLRPADLPFLLLGIVPGAVIGGRLDYVFVHLDYYLAHAAAILDPAQGSLGLGLAVPGGILGGIVIARLIDAPVDRWLHAAVLPTLFVLATGKLSGVLSAEGQGQPMDLPWATSYLGDGPWASLAPSIPSHPSQIYEAILTLAVLVLFGVAMRAGAFPRRDGSSLAFAVGLWALARLAIIGTWRDATVLGPIRAEQLVMLALVLGCFLGAVRLRKTAAEGTLRVRRL